MDEKRTYRRLWEIVCEKSLTRQKSTRTRTVADVSLQIFSCATCIIEDIVGINFKRKTMHEKRNSCESRWKTWRPNDLQHAWLYETYSTAKTNIIWIRLHGTRTETRTAWMYFMDRIIILLLMLLWMFMYSFSVS